MLHLCASRELVYHTSRALTISLISIAADLSKGYHKRLCVTYSMGTLCEALTW